MFTAREVTDKIAKHTAVIIEESPTTSEAQAKRIAHKIVLHEYETEKFWLQAFQSKYRELLDKVRFNDSVIGKLRKDYKKKSERLLEIERFIFYLENTTYTHFK